MPRSAPAAEALIGIEHVLPMHRGGADHHDQENHRHHDHDERKTAEHDHVTPLPSRAGNGFGGAGDRQNVTPEMIAAPGPH